jgi:hypothetical protein
MDSLKGVGLAFDSNYQEAPLFSNEPSQANQFLAVEDILCVRGEIPEEKIPEIEASKEASLRKKQCRGALGKLK